MSEDFEESDLDAKVDFSKVKKLFVNPTFYFILLLAIALGVGIYLRTWNTSIPITEKWAQASVDSQIKANLQSQITQSYPNLPTANLQAEVDKGFMNYVNTNGGEYDSAIKSVSKQIKATYKYADANGNPDVYTYMPDIDPYFYLRQARNLVDKGTVADEWRDGKAYDNLQLAPLGQPTGNSIHPYVLFGMFKVMNLFDSNITLMQAAAFFPALLVALGILFAFLVGKKLSNNLGGFFTAMFVATTIAILSRTTWGHADTDAYNVFFSFLLVWGFLCFYESKKLVSKIGWGAMIGVSLGLYAWAWDGWWYMLDFILAAIALHVGIELFKYRKVKEVQNSVIGAAVIFFSTMLVTVSLKGIGAFVSFIKGPLGFITIKSASTTNYWPNVLTTVAEMNSSNWNTIIAQLGGMIFLVIGLAGFVFILFKKREDKWDFTVPLLLLMWFASTVYAAFQGVRFIILIAPAFAVGFGAFFGLLSDWLGEKSNSIHLHKSIMYLFVFLIGTLLFITPIKQGVALAENDLPMINDAWVTALTMIKNDSQPNAIVNSWWDFGHHFKYFTERPVTFDGGTQTSPQAHWVGKVLLTHDEDIAIGILRMLDCGGNTAFDEVDKTLNDTSESVKLLNDIIILDKGAAGQKLAENGISESVLQYTHCTPPQDYFITSEDMIGKAGVWAHFAGWDFDRADWWTNLRGKSHDEVIKILTNPPYSITNAYAEDVYTQLQSIPDETAANSWISPWPSYSNSGQCQQYGSDSVLCQQGVFFNKTTGEAVLLQQSGAAIPQTLVGVQNDNWTVKRFNSTNDFAINYFGGSSILMQDVLAESMFNRLFYFDGVGLEHFEKFTEQRDLSGFRIIVWKVKW